MKKGLNVIEKLEVVAERERKRREQAENYLEQLTEILAPKLEEIIGNDINDHVDNHTITVKKWHKEEEKYGDNDLYFRFGVYESWHNGNCSTEYEGFYINDQQYMELWGTNILDVKGAEFWYRVKQIVDWVNNYLPEYISRNEESRDKRYDQLVKIVETLKEVN